MSDTAIRLAPCGHQPPRPVLITAIPVTWSDGHARLICPECGFGYVKPICVGCGPAGDSGGAVLVSHEGILWDPKFEPQYDGVCISLLFRCGLGHVFEYELRFQDGQTQVRRQCCPDVPNMPPIWRKRS